MIDVENMNIILNKSRKYDYIQKEAKYLDKRLKENIKVIML